MTNLQIGQRIYNHGDRANDPHFGTIVEIKSDKWGTQYQILPDDYKERDHSERTGSYWIAAVGFSPEYRGNGSSRFVTIQAYNEYRRQQLENLKPGLSAEYCPAE